MNSLYIKPGDLINYESDSKEFRLIKIYVNMAKADFALRLLRQKEGYTIDSQDFPYSIASGVGSIYEALNDFAFIKKYARDAITSSDNNYLNSLNFLCSKEVNKFHTGPLFGIRNKLAFHTDADHLGGFLMAVNSSGDNELKLLESHNENHVSFDLAQKMIGTWVVDFMGGPERSHESGKMLTEILMHLGVVTYTLSKEWLNARLERISS